MPTTLAVLLLTAAAPPDGPTAGPPRLVRGDEFVYAGRVTEASDRVTNRFRKTADLEVRVFVLDAGPTSADCAVLTKVRPNRDAVISGASAVVSGADPNRGALPPAVRVDLVRVDGRGRAALLQPPAGPPPIPLGPETPTAAAPPVPVEGPPAVELGMFVPLPPHPVGVGGRWDVADPGRPVVGWGVDRETVWNGGRVLVLAAEQHTDGWDRPLAAPTGWRRTEVVQASPADGIAASVVRRTEVREGRDVAGWVEVRYDLRSSVRHIGGRYTDTRREAEAAVGFAADLAALLAKPGTPDPREFSSRLLKIDRFLADAPVPTGFREGVEAVRRRCVAAARGEAAPDAIVLPAAHAAPADLPDVGKLAPDFLAPRVGETEPVRLSGLRGKPAVLVFFKPGASTSRPALLVAEALHRRFDGRAAVVAVAVGAAPEVAARQREDMGLTLPVVDGAGVRTRYGIDTYPRFFAVDPAGTLSWRFDGIGQETGFLARTEVDRLLAK